MEVKANIKVGDKVKLKSLDYIKRKFRLFEDQELYLAKNQGKIFKVVRIPDGTKSVVLDAPVFESNRPFEDSEIHRDAVYLYKKATNISLPEQLFEI